MKKLLFIIILAGIVMVHTYGIDLKFIKQPKYTDNDIPNEYTGSFKWISDTEIYHSGHPYAIILDIKNDKVYRILDHGNENIHAGVIFQNEEIILIERYNATTRFTDYIIRDQETENLYYLNENGKEEYLADGGKDYRYYLPITNVIRDTRERQLTLTLFSLLNGKIKEFWTVDPNVLFDTRLSTVYKIDEYKKLWLVRNRERIYIMDWTKRGIESITSFSDDVGDSGAFLKDGRVIKAYVDWENDSGYDLEGTYFYRLGVFNQEGEFEQEISRDVFAADSNGKISVSPDGSKLLVVGIDNNIDWRIAPELFIYEIIYD